VLRSPAGEARELVRLPFDRKDLANGIEGLRQALASGQASRDDTGRLVRGTAARQMVVLQFGHELTTSRCGRCDPRGSESPAPSSYQCYGYVMGKVGTSRHWGDAQSVDSARRENFPLRLSGSREPPDNITEWLGQGST